MSLTAEQIQQLLEQGDPVSFRDGEGPNALPRSNRRRRNRRRNRPQSMDSRPREKRRRLSRSEFRRKMREYMQSVEAARMQNRERNQSVRELNESNRSRGQRQSEESKSFREFQRQMLRDPQRARIRRSLGRPQDQEQQQVQVNQERTTRPKKQGNRKRVDPESVYKNIEADFGKATADLQRYYDSRAQNKDGMLGFDLDQNLENSLFEASRNELQERYNDPLRFGRMGSRTDSKYSVPIEDRPGFMMQNPTQNRGPGALPGMRFG